MSLDPSANTMSALPQGRSAEEEEAIVSEAFRSTRPDYRPVG